MARKASARKVQRRGSTPPATALEWREHTVMVRRLKVRQAREVVARLAEFDNLDATQGAAAFESLCGVLDTLVESMDGGDWGDVVETVDIREFAQAVLGFFAGNGSSSGSST